MWSSKWVILDKMNVFLERHTHYQNWLKKKKIGKSELLKTSNGDWIGNFESSHKENPYPEGFFFFNQLFKELIPIILQLF